MESDGQVELGALPGSAFRSQRDQDRRLARKILLRGRLFLSST